MFRFQKFPGYPDWFIPTIRLVLQVEIPTPTKLTLRFELSPEAAQHNMSVLQACNNNLHQYLLTQRGSFIDFGSEFRHPEVLHLLLCHHPTWPRLRKILEEGSSWPLTPISHYERIQKNEELILRGNHKSALKYHADLGKTLINEVSQGWMFPLPLPYISCLNHGELAPVGMDDKQWSVLPDGSRQQKLRLTHDQSFEMVAGPSVNARVLTHELEPLYYGGCLSRVIHYMLSLRLRHPKVRILAGKCDIKAAYRRITLHGDTAAKCTIMYNGLGLVSSRLTFGGSPCPNEFCIPAEMTTDLANDILHCPAWDSRVLSSPHAEKLRPPKFLDQSIPFATSLDLDVEVPPDDWGRIDDFIDDGIVVTPDIGENVARAIPAMLLAIHVMFRPIDSKENIKRDDCLSLGKLQEEGFLTETPTILGWEINTRSLTIRLPEKKFKVWHAELHEVITQKKISFTDLEKLIGRLNHTAAACPLMRYFLNRIRNVQINWHQSNYSKKVKRYLPSPALEDLRLWHRRFLPKIYEGMSLNLISYRRPSVVSWSDACPQGLGGFDSNGNAWQYQLSEADSKACHRQNNSLEFVAALILVWCSIVRGPEQKEACFLALCDNTSAVGWLHKANIDDTKNLPLHVAARKYADILLQVDCCLYSQHIAGAKNKVADLLSRKFDLPYDSLTTHIHSLYPNQVPLSFKISPLPPEICSWLTSWLQKCREKWGLHREQKIKNEERGIGGARIRSASDSRMTSGLRNLPQSTELPSLAPLPQLSDEDSSPDQILQTWHQAQSKRPLLNWVRFLGQTWGTTPHMPQVLKPSIQLCQDNSRE